MSAQTNVLTGAGYELCQAKLRADRRRSLTEAFNVLDSAIDDLEEEYDVLLNEERAALDLLYTTAERVT